MILKGQLQEHGNFLYRHRSFLPLALLPFTLIAISASGVFERRFGQRFENAWEIMYLAVSISGLLVRALTVGHAPGGVSGRNSSGQRAEVLNTTGLNSVTRNPLYLGNFLTLLGFVLGITVWWLVLITCTAFALYYERIICAEEAFLERKFGVTCTSWAEKTPVFIPDLRLWKPSDLPFSVRHMLCREYHAFTSSSPSSR